MKKNLILLILFTFSTTATATYYPLICKGGPTIKVGAKAIVKKGIMNSNSIVNWQQIMHIKSGDGPADPSGFSLNPGECSFVDRRLRVREPRKLLFDTVYFEMHFDSNGTLNVISALQDRMKNSNHVATFLVKRFGEYFLVK